MSTPRGFLTSTAHPPLRKLSRIGTGARSSTPEAAPTRVKGSNEGKYRQIFTIAPFIITRKTAHMSTHRQPDKQITAICSVEYYTAIKRNPAALQQG
jgi:hypothetical protein